MQLFFPLPSLLLTDTPHPAHPHLATRVTTLWEPFTCEALWSQQWSTCLTVSCTRGKHTRPLEIQQILPGSKASSPRPLLLSPVQPRSTTSTATSLRSSPPKRPTTSSRRRRATRGRSGSMPSKQCPELGSESRRLLCFFCLLFIIGHTNDDLLLYCMCAFLKS